LLSSKQWTLVASILASSLTFIDGTAVNVALPALQAHLGATITDVQWVLEAYTLLYGSLILVGGSLGDQLGRKRVFLVGVYLFTVASVLCGIAPTPALLIAARAFQGVGAALLAPGSLALVSAAFDDDERGLAIGTWSAFSAVTTAIGPVGGGWLIEHVSWRAVFLLNVPLAAIVVWLSMKHVDESRDPSRHGRIDWLGAALTVIGLSGLTYGLLELPVRGSGHLMTTGMIAIGAFALVSFVLVERVVANPMLPLGVFRSSAFTLTNTLTFLLYGALSTMLFIVPLVMIQVGGYSPTAAGAALLPFTIILFLMSRWAGGLVARVGHRLPLTAGPAVAAVGFVLFAILPGETDGSYWIDFVVPIVVLAVGMGVTVAPLTTTVMTAAGREHAGVASGVNNAVARIGGLVAIAVFGVVLARSFESRVQPKLDHMTLSPTTRTALQNELPKMAGMKLDSIPELRPDARALVQWTVDRSFMSSYRVVMLWVAGLALAAALIGLLIA
jgi:EmrB/QacA subfamily drug resistance transporter